MLKSPPLPWLEVVAAVIMRQQQLLLAQRAPNSHLAGQWEFPGGKLLPNETFAQGICREIDEELALPVQAMATLACIEHHYHDKAVRLHFIACQLIDQRPPLCRVHAQIGWFTYQQAMQLPLATADRRFLESSAAVDYCAVPAAGGLHTVSVAVARPGTADGD